MSEYKVKFEVFEGPLDLLLYLIKKQEVDIYEVNLTQLATQFIEYIEVLRMLAAGFRSVSSANPYWDVRGRTFEDLDGYRVVLQNSAWEG